MAKTTIAMAENNQRRDAEKAEKGTDPFFEASNLGDLLRLGKIDLSPFLPFLHPRRWRA
jgi:hypothetical protein